LKKPLPEVDDGKQQQYTIQVFSLQRQHVKCAAKHIEKWVVCCKGENPESFLKE
jgi:hypothetical protein